MSQLDRTLLRTLRDLRPRTGVETDEHLTQATDQQLHATLACLDEPEFRDLHPLNLRPKIQALLQHRGVLNASQVVELTEQRNFRRWIVTTIIAVFGVLLTVALKSCTH